MSHKTGVKSPLFNSQQRICTERDVKLLDGLRQMWNGRIAENTDPLGEWPNQVEWNGIVFSTAIHSPEKIPLQNQWNLLIYPIQPTLSRSQTLKFV